MCLDGLPFGVWFRLGCSLGDEILMWLIWKYFFYFLFLFKILIVVFSHVQRLVQVLNHLFVVLLFLSMSNYSLYCFSSRYFNLMSIMGFNIWQTISDTISSHRTSQTPDTWRLWRILLIIVSQKCLLPVKELILPEACSLSLSTFNHCHFVSLGTCISISMTTFRCFHLFP